MADKQKGTTRRYMVQLDPQVASLYRKLSTQTQIPVVRLVNSILKGMAPNVEPMINRIVQERQSSSVLKK